MKNLLFKSWMLIMLFSFLGSYVAFGQATLMHSYDFETDLTDGTGSVDGTAHGTASIAGGGLVLDANGDYISFDGTALDLNSYGAITMEYIFEGSAAANTAWNWTGYFGDDGGANNFRTSLGHWNDEIRTVYTGYEILLDGQDVNNGNKHQIVTVLTPDSLIYYEDGTRRDGIATGGSFTIGTAQSYLGKGSDAWGGDPTWQGVIYEFNIYDGKMSAEAVSSAYNDFVLAQSTILTGLSSTEGIIYFMEGSSTADLVIAPETTSLVLSATAESPQASIDVDGQGSESATITITSLPQTVDIVVTSGDGNDMQTYTVTIIDCYEPAYTDRDNLIADPTFSASSLSTGGYAGWGPTGIETGDSKYCGYSSAFIRGSCWPNGGSIDRNLDAANGNALQANTSYRLRAMLKSQAHEGTIFQLVVKITNSDLRYFDIDTTNGWVQFDTIFTTGETVEEYGLFFNSCAADQGKTSPPIEDTCFIDNYELFVVDTLATLSDLQVDGTTVDGFDAATYSYDVELPYGTASAPAVTATTTNALASAVVTDAAELPGSTVVEVTADDGTTILTYTVNFTLAAPATDATLSDLQVDGTTVDAFDAGTYSYDMVLASGTTTVPTVTATTTDANAEAVVNDATALPGATTVDVTAEDGTTSLTYTVNFTLASAVSDVDGETISVYPTVSKGDFTVVSSGNETVISVYDIKGEVVLKKEATATKQILSIPNPGMYIIQVTNNNATVSFRVLKTN